MPDSQTENLPTASVANSSKGRGFFWLLPVVALIAALLMMKQYWQERGIPITITFVEGHGLKAGDVLKCRGIIIGQVEDIELTEDLSEVKVSARVDPSAGDVLRETTDFWIVRPELNISGVRGLDTLVGAKFIRVEPNDGGAYTDSFTGVEDPPMQQLVDPLGRFINFQARDVSGIRVGSLISYRQMPVGMILSMELDDSREFVELEGYLQPEYADLARSRTVFWKDSGAKVEAGLFSGLTFEMDSVENLLMGGISLAYPMKNPGVVVTNGYQYRIYMEPQDAWLDWLIK